MFKLSDRIFNLFNETVLKIRLILLTTTPFRKKFSQFSLFAVLMFYNAAIDTELVIADTLLLREIQNTDLCFCEPLVIFPQQIST